MFFYRFPVGKTSFRFQKLHFPVGKTVFGFQKLHFPVGKTIFRFQKVHFPVGKTIFRFQKLLFPVGKRFSVSWGTFRRPLFLVHPVDNLPIVLGDDGAAQLQRIGQLAALYAEGLGQEGEALHLLVVGKLLLQRVDAVAVEGADGFVLHQLLAAAEGDALRAGILLQQVVGGHDEGGDELALVGDDGHLVDVAVYDELRLQRLRRDVLAVRRLEQVLDALLQVERAALQASGVARVEPSVLVDGLGRRNGFLIVAARDGPSAQQDFVVRPDLHLQVGHHLAHRADDEPRGGEARHGGGRLRQAVADDHVDAYGVDKLAHLVRYRRAGRGEERAALDADGLLQQGVDGLLVELVAQVEHQGRRLAQADVLQVVFAARADGVEQHRPADARLLGDAFLYALVHFLPEAGDAAHHRGAHLFDRRLDVLRMQVDADLHAALQADICPASLEDVRQRQEAHRHILVRHLRQADVVRAEGLEVVCVVEHHALRFARRAGRVEDVGQVVGRRLRRAFFHHLVVRQAFTQSHELVEVKGGRVARVAHHVAVEDNEPLQRLAQPDDAEGGVVLELFAHEEEAYLRVVDDVLCLRRRAGGIQRNGHRAVGERRKVDVQAFGLVLRKDADILLLADAQRHHCVGGTAYALGELFPRHRNPLCRFIVPVFQGHFVSILLCLTMDHDR